MAEHGQRGQVLWWLLLLLGLFAELAVVGLQLAVRGALAARAEEQGLQRSLRALAIARSVAALPLPMASAPYAAGESPWHPAHAPGETVQSCGLTGQQAYDRLASCAGDAYLPAAQAMRPGAGWLWRLQRLPDQPGDVEEGSDLSAFPMLRRQAWLLQVMVRSADGHIGGWQMSYRQRAAP